MLTESLLVDDVQCPFTTREQALLFLNITDGSEQGVDDLTLLDLANTLYAAKKSLLATVQDREDSHADYLKSDSYFP